MAAELVGLRANFWVRLRGSWRAFSKTAVGDIVATAVALFVICLIFVASALALIVFFRVAGFVLAWIGSMRDG